MKRYISILFLLPFFFFKLYAQEGILISSEKIGYVDIERVFNEYLATQKARETLSEEIRLNREKIISQLKTSSDLLTSPTVFMPLSISTYSVIMASAPVVSISSSTVSISTSTISISTSTIITKETIDLLEKSFTQREKEIRNQILGKIYDTIQKVARLRHIDIVLDKKNIVYSEKEIDLTNDVIKRLNKEYLEKEEIVK